MLTRLRVRNFKNLGEIDIELGQNVVLIGPNNSGKTSALQAIALWRAGVVALSSAKAELAGEFPEAIINRLSLTQIPVSATQFLWSNTDVGQPGAFYRGNGGASMDFTVHGKPLAIAVEGESSSGRWQCDLAFHWANTETVRCLLVHVGPSDDLSVLKTAAHARVAYLPPMSGLAAEEAEIPAGRIDVLVGEGQTAQVLRNLCLHVNDNDPSAWREITSRVRRLFGVALHVPTRDPARGSVLLRYDQQDTTLDIAAAGRGMQQTLLLLAHLHANPGSVLLLDEPDAHLEIFRQREIYNLLTETAGTTGSQIIAASHSEVILNEAADRDTVIAFVGAPHPLIGRGSQLRKALSEIGFDQYYQAELKRTVLYLEGATDLAILRAFAHRLNHPVQAALESPFVKYVANQPRSAEHHFHGLREAFPDLRGFALFDRLARGLPERYSIPTHCWHKQEIENYLADRATLLAFALGAPAPQAGRRDIMERTLLEIESAFAVLNRDPWSDDVKMSEDVLPPIFANFYKALGLTDIMAKADYHELIAFKDPTTIDPEVTEVLDRLLAAIG